MRETTPDDPIASVVRVLDAVAARRDPALVLAPDARRAASRLSELLAARDDNLEARHVLGWWHWYRYLALPEDEDQEAWDTAAQVLTPCFVADVENLPEPLVPVLAHYAAEEAEDVLSDAIAADDAALARAATLWRRIVAATPPDNPRLPGMLANLAVALQAQHRWSGDSADLETAIAVLRRAVSLPASPTAEDEAAMLSNLAGALSARFSATGHTDDLDEAIEIMRRVMALAGPAHLAYQTNLSGALATRFERRGTRPDLDEAIAGLHEAVSTAGEQPPPELPAALSTLGVLVRLLFNRTGEEAAVDLAVKIGRLAADAVPPGHPGRHRVLSNLAGSLRRRAEYAGEPADFDAAVHVGREAMGCTPVGYDDARQTRVNLADLLCGRFERCGDLDDLDEAIEIVQDVAEGVDGAGSVTAMSLAILGRALMLRHQRLGSEADFGRAVIALTRAAGMATAAPSIRVWAARDAAGLVGRRDPSAAASLLESAVTLVPRIASRHLGRRDQEFALRQVAGLATDAAALALAAALARRDPVPDPVPQSLGLLELGRGVMLGQLLDAHDDLARLHAQHHGIARRLTELRDELDQISTDVVP